MLFFNVYVFHRLKNIGSTPNFDIEPTLTEISMPLAEVAAETPEHHARDRNLLLMWKKYQKVTHEQEKMSIFAREFDKKDVANFLHTNLLCLHLIDERAATAHLGDRPGRIRASWLEQNPWR